MASEYNRNRSGARSSSSRSNSSSGGRHSSSGGSRSSSGSGGTRRSSSTGGNRSSSGGGSSSNRNSGGGSRTSRSKQSRRNTVEYWYGIGTLAIILAALNIFAWMSAEFCDWYSRYVLPLWLNTYGRITALFPFSLGEILLIVAMILIVLALLLWIPMVLVKRKRKAPEVYFGIRSFYRFFLAAVMNIALIMTLNCFIMYHCTPLDPNPEAETREYTPKELATIHDYVVSEANALAETFERDDKGYIVADMEQVENACVTALKKLGTRYPKLAGWYPRVKTIDHSDLMSQAYTSGVYFPFSLEANVNGIMYVANYPEVICHELSHLRGYIYENEANFLAYVACTESEDPFLRYSGYLGVLYYLQSDLAEAMEHTAVTIEEEPSEWVYFDNCFLTPEAWEEVEEDATISTDVVDNISDKVTDTTLQMNGVESGIASYSEVVELLLQYYDGVLY